MNKQLMKDVMITLTQRARQKLEEVAQSLPEQHSPIWDVVFMGFGWGGPRMGLVQSQSSHADETIEVDGFQFTIPHNLKRFISVYGNLLIDFKKSFWGDDFIVRFAEQGSCGWYFIAESFLSAGVFIKNAPAAAIYSRQRRISPVFFLSFSSSSIPEAHHIERLSRLAPERSPEIITNDLFAAKKNFLPWQKCVC